MRTVIPEAIVDLDHPTDWIGVGGGTIASASHSGHISIVNQALELKTRLARRRVRSVSVNPGGERVAIVDEDGARLSIVDASTGTEIKSIESPHVRPSGVFESYGFSACRFHDDGRHLWVSARITETLGRVTIYDSALTLIASLDQTGHFEDNYIGLSGPPGSVYLMLGGGQDGANASRLRWNGARGDVEPFPTWTWPLALADGSREILCGRGLDQIVIVDEASSEIVRSMEWEEGQFMGAAQYVDGKTAVVGSTSGLFLIDTERMELTDQVGIEGIGSETFDWSPVELMRMGSAIVASMSGYGRPLSGMTGSVMVVMPVDSFA